MKIHQGKIREMPGNLHFLECGKHNCVDWPPKPTSTSANPQSTHSLMPTFKDNPKKWDRTKPPRTKPIALNDENGQNSLLGILYLFSPKDVAICKQDEHLVMASFLQYL